MFFPNYGSGVTKCLKSTKFGWQETKFFLFYKINNFLPKNLQKSSILQNNVKISIFLQIFRSKIFSFVK